MSQIASFYLVRDDKREELSNGECSGDVYMPIWDYCEGELDIDGRFSAPEMTEALDCLLFDEEMAGELLEALAAQDLQELAAELASDWDLPCEAMKTGLETLVINLKKVDADSSLLYEMF